MLQEVMVGVLFIVAVAYVARLLYSSFKAKNGACTKGCGSCSALDIKKIEEQLRKNTH